VRVLYCMDVRGLWNIVGGIWWVFHGVGVLNLFIIALCGFKYFCKRVGLCMCGFVVWVVYVWILYCMDV
jgi:hypothetical protein